mgnify:CR=1 FL=1
MKNFKKIASLVLAICMIASLAIGASAANTVDASGGTGTSSVTLSTTADAILAQCNVLSKPYDYIFFG